MKRRASGAGIFTAWRVSFPGASAILAWLAIPGPDPYPDILKLIPDCILVTFEVTVVSIFFSLILGLIAGLGRISRTLTPIGESSQCYLKHVVYEPRRP